MNEDELSNLIIGAAIEVHREVGPGLLESVYEECMAFELASRGIPFERQKEIALVYKGKILPSNLRIDLFVGGMVIVELKSIDTVLPIHEAQLLTYLKMTNCKLGLILNFNVKRLKDGGINRKVNNL